MESDLSAITSYSQVPIAICPEHVDPLSVRHMGKEEGNNEERFSANSYSYSLAS